MESTRKCIFIPPKSQNFGVSHLETCHGNHFDSRHNKSFEAKSGKLRGPCACVLVILSRMSRFLTILTMCWRSPTFLSTVCIQTAKLIDCQPYSLVSTVISGAFVTYSGSEKQEQLRKSMDIAIF